MTPSLPVGYRLVRLANGSHSIHALDCGETFHPVIGPVAEAQALYLHQMRLPERITATSGEFVIWDIGLGAAANPLTILAATRNLPGTLRLLSFEKTLDPLHFALAHAPALGYFDGYENPLRELLRTHAVTFQNGTQTIHWQLHLGDFPTLIATHPNHPPYPAPHAILFDAFSPARNPAMWTLPLFQNLYQHLDPARPCAMPTYSRSTLLRVTLLLAGFFVGTGHATGEKEETTIAANTLTLLSHPLDKSWLARAARSTSAEPLHEPIYRQAPLSPATQILLHQHPQFR